MLKVYQIETQNPGSLGIVDRVCVAAPSLEKALEAFRPSENTAKVTSIEKIAEIDLMLPNIE